MLVLSRRDRERILIFTQQGQVIGITLLDKRGDKTRIGIEADESVTVLREEIYLERLAEAKASREQELATTAHS